MMPICRRPTRGSGPDPRASGFTLIEMLVVLTIVGLAVAIMVGVLGRKPAGFQRRQAAMTIEAAILAAERQAQSTGQVTRLVPSQLVDGASLTAGTFASTGDAATLIFHPDGSNSGGTVLLADRPLLSVDWLTGEVDRGS